MSVMRRRSATAMMRSGVGSGSRRALIVTHGCFQRLALLLLSEFIVSASDYLCLPLQICGFGLFEDVDEMLALLLTR